jgi:hypothetical protein
VPGTERCFRRPLALGVAVVVGGCAAGPSFVSVTKTMTAPRIAASAPSSVVVSAPLGRRSIGEPEHETLPFELLPMAGGRSLLAVSQTADDLRVWARRIDGATGAQGELLALEGERIAAAFDAPDGGTTIVTTQGASVCIALLAAGATSVASRSCASITPVAVARIGGRLAAIELDDSSGNTRRGPVDARVRWVSPGGSFETTSVDAGLHFDRPLAGMTVADTASRGDLLDVLFFESVPGVRPKGKLGRARLAIATLGGDGKIVARSRHVLAAGELEIGHIAGRTAARHRRRHDGARDAREPRRTVSRDARRAEGRRRRNDGLGVRDRSNRAGTRDAPRDDARARSRLRCRSKTRAAPDARRRAARHLGRRSRVLRLERRFEVGRSRDG